MIKTLHIGCDHAAVDLKDLLVHALEDRYNVVDHGTHSHESCDYPDFAHAVCRAVEQDPDSNGILLCGTGIGMSIAANRHDKIRAALCTTELHASFTRRHNDANVLCLGARMTGEELAMAIVETFLHTDFEGGRHTRRIEKLSIRNEAE